MTLITKIGAHNRLTKLLPGQPENQPSRVQELNEVIEEINSTDSGSIIVTTGTNTPTINSRIGRFTSAALTTAAVSSEIFTITNSKVKVGQSVIAWIESYSGTISTNGIPVMYGNTRADKSITITIANVHASNALSGTVTIGFIVI